MQHLQILFLIGVVLIFPVIAYTSQSCQIVQDLFEVCKNSSTLTSVKQINDSSDQLPSENSLIISDKEIRSIAPNAFKNLTLHHLILDVANDKLDIVPNSFNGLPNIILLDIFSGAIFLADHLFCRIRSISALSISVEVNGPIHAEALSELRELKKLKIYNSTLQNINDQTFRNIQPQILQLELVKNNISTIGSSTFSNFEQLTHLEMSINFLVNITTGTFDGLNKLEDLKMTWNQWVVISQGSFMNLTYLRVVRISHNDRITINKQAFAGMHLSMLDLRNNNLRLLQFSQFQGINVDSLVLSGNNLLHVDCNTFGLSKIKTLYLNHMNILAHIGRWGFTNATEIILKDA